MALACGLAASPGRARDLSAISLFVSATYHARPADGEAWRCLAGVDVAFDVLANQALSARRSFELSEPTFARSKAEQAVEPPPQSSAGLPSAVGSGSAQGKPTDTTAASAPAASAPAESASPLVLSVGLLRAAVRAALQAFDAGAPRARLESLRGRARSSAALPEVSVRGGRSTDRSIRTSPTVDEPDRLILAGGADFFVEARMTWKLDRLLFAREELSVERLIVKRDERRLQWAREVVTQLFNWQKALIEQEKPLALPEERLLAELRALEAAAAVDTLTSGWFSEQLETLRPVDSTSGRNQ